MPAYQTARVDTLLTNVAIDYWNEKTSFIGGTLMPSLVVKETSGIYYKYRQADLIAVDDLIAPGAEPRKVSYGMEQITFGPIENRGLEDHVTDKLGKQMGQGLAEKNALLRLMAMMDISRELRVATIMSDNAVITQYNTFSGTDRWDDGVNSDPIGDVEEGKDAVETGCLQDATHLVLSRSAFKALRTHPKLISRISGHKTHLSIDDMKVIFDIENIVIAKAKHNSGTIETPVMTDIWGNHAWVMYINPKASKETESITFGHTLRVEGESEKTTVEKEYNKKANKTEIWTNVSSLELVMATECAYFLETVVN